MRTKTKFITIFLIAFLLGSVITYTLAQTGNTFIISTGIYPRADYTIYLEGSTYYAKSAYGQNAYYNSNVSLVIQYAINDLTSGLIVLREIMLPLTVTLKEDVTVREIFNGQTLDYPFPRNMPAITETWILGCGSAYDNGTCFVVRYPKNAWVNSSAPRYTGHLISKIDIDTVRNFDFGTYQFKYYHTGNETGKEFAVGFFWLGSCAEGGVYFMQKPDGSLVTDTGWGGSATQTAITGWNPNVESTLKIQWNSTHVLFYVNDSLRTTHTTNIPQEPLNYGWSIVHSSRTSDFTYESYMFTREFRRV